MNWIMSPLGKFVMGGIASFLMSAPTYYLANRPAASLVAVLCAGGVGVGSYLGGIFIAKTTQ